MGWLVRDGEVLAALEVAGTRRQRRRGLLGRDRLEGALLLRPCRSVHTVGMRFAIDVGFCAPLETGELEVIMIRTMPRHRVGRPVWKARAVIEAEAGAFTRWGLRPGDRLEIR